MDKYQKLIAQLSELKNILEDARATLQWHKLKVFEKNLNPSNKIFFQDHTPEQLARQQTDFWLISANVDVLLQSTSIRKYPEYRKEFKKLCMQFYYLGSDVRVY
ncbi:MAG: hypothetical protein A2Y10_08380 [Planctomycetes bacterium GWF2_41_51]|nr:MAG: hypothetical protein A2Y10_08380 [Planctomycetes bacterium GWF2_41_51]HBG25833.1 hypothetical protein [Phycisphaerales bacterium]